MLHHKTLAVTIDDEDRVGAKQVLALSKAPLHRGKDSVIAGAQVPGNVGLESPTTEAPPWTGTNVGIAILLA